MCPDTTRIEGREFDMKFAVVLCGLVTISGCVFPKYSLVTGEYSYLKEGEKAQQYFSRTVYRINHETGETSRIDWKGGDYYWRPVAEASSEK